MPEVPSTISDKQWDDLNRRAGKVKVSTTKALQQMIAAQQQMNKRGQS